MTSGWQSVQAWLKSKSALVPKLVLDKASDITRSRRRLARDYRDNALKEYAKDNAEVAQYYYQKAIELKPKDPVLHADLAQIYYEQGKFDKAVEYYWNALEYDDSNLQALKGLGLTLHQMGHLDEAMYVYLMYLELNDEDVDVLVNTGALLYTLDRYDEAIEYYQRAETLDPENVMVQVNLSVVRYYLGDFEEAINSLNRAQELDPENAHVLVLRGLVLEAMGDNDGALDSYKKAVEKDPDTADAYLYMARPLSERGRYGEALKNAELALNLYEKQKDKQKTASALWDIGWNYYKLGDWKNCVKASRKALDIDPNLSPVRFNMALALLHQGNQDEAQKNYNEGIERLSNLSDLKTHAIDDLKEVLRKGIKLPGGEEILQSLEKEYTLLKESREGKY